MGSSPHVGGSEHAREPCLCTGRLCRVYSSGELFGGGWKLLGKSWELCWHRGSKQSWEELPALLSGDPNSLSSSCCEQQHHRISLV